MGRAQLKRKPQVVYQSTEGPTSDRIRHSEGFFEIGGEDRASQKYSMLDSPLDRLKARDAIDTKGHEALRRYGEHFYQGGLLGSVGSVSLDSIFASPFCRDHMAKTEGQVDHRLEYARAKYHLSKARAPYGSKYDDQTYAHKMRIVTDNVVCGEWELHIAGHAIGFASPYRGRQAVTEMLNDAGYRLAKLWGIG